MHPVDRVTRTTHGTIRYGSEWLRSFGRLAFLAGQQIGLLLLLPDCLNGSAAFRIGRVGFGLELRQSCLKEFLAKRAGHQLHRTYFAQ